MKLVVRVAILLLALGGSLTPAAADGHLLTFAAPDCDYGGNLSAIEAVDAHTFRVTLCNPDAIFDQEMASLGMSIHPGEILEATGGTGDLLTKPIGTGPLKPVNRDQGNENVHERFDDYPGENLHIFGDLYPDIYESLVAAGQELDLALRQELFREVAAGIDANDVVTTWQAAGDACSPLHTGTGEGFAIHIAIFQQFVNADMDCG